MFVPNSPFQSSTVVLMLKIKNFVKIMHEKKFCSSLMALALRFQHTLLLFITTL